LSVGDDASARGGRFGRPLRPRRRIPKCFKPADAPRTEPTVKRGDPVREVSHSAAIVVIWRARVKQIAINIGSDHYQLIDETNEQRLIFSRPSRGHRLLHDIVSHAMSDQGYLRFAGFRGIIYGRLLFSDQPIEERAQNVC
jgi:hypothetical protein